MAGNRQQMMVKEAFIYLMMSRRFSDAHSSPECLTASLPEQISGLWHQVENEPIIELYMVYSAGKWMNYGMELSPVIKDGPVRGNEADPKIQSEAQKM